MFRDFSFIFGRRRQAILVGDGGAQRDRWPMAMHTSEESGRCLLDLCNANGLRLSTSSRARSAPCARAA